MLTNIQIRNFKGLGKVSFDLTKLNLFIGENGSGKSTVIQALSIVKQSMGSALRIVTDLPYINLGTLDKIIPPGETATIIIGGTELMDLKPIQQSQVDFSCRIEFDVQGIMEYECECQVRLEPTPVVIKSQWTRYGVIKVEPQTIKVSDITFNIEPSTIIGQVFAPSGYALRSDDPVMARRAQDVHQSLRKIASILEQALRKFTVVPVIRGFLEPSYPLQPTVPTDLNSRAGMAQMGGILASRLVYLDSRSKNLIRDWLKYTMEVDAEWGVIQGALVTITNPNIDTYFVNEGFGSNQLIFVLEEIARMEKDSLIAVEEPEIHLHPKAQFRFGKLAAKITKEENKQLLLVTHSEHIVSAVLTGIKNGDIERNQVGLWFFERKDGKAVATKIEIDEKGRTVGGLTTFLEASIEELREYTK